MNNKQKNIVLDPLTTLFKLAILKFYPMYTKLSFTNYQIYIQLPSTYQGSLRMLYGDTREDLHNLHNPILKVIQWYPYNKYENLQSIYDFAISGIKMLKYAYSNNGAIILHSLELYLSLISQHLEHNEQTTISDDDLVTRDNIFREQLENMWDVSEIQTIVILFLLLENKFESKKDYNYIIDSINCILSNKDSVVESIIKQHTMTL